MAKKTKQEFDKRMRALVKSAGLSMRQFAARVAAEKGTTHGSESSTVRRQFKRGGAEDRSMDAWAHVLKVPRTKLPKPVPPPSTAELDDRLGAIEESVGDLPDARTVAHRLEGLQGSVETILEALLAAGISLPRAEASPQSAPTSRRKKTA